MYATEIKVDYSIHNQRLRMSVKKKGIKFCQWVSGAWEVIYEHWKGDRSQTRSLWNTRRKRIFTRCWVANSYRKRPVSYVICIPSSFVVLFVSFVVLFVNFVDLFVSFVNLLISYVGWFVSFVVLFVGFVLLFVSVVVLIVSFVVLFVSFQYFVR